MDTTTLRTFIALAQIKNFTKTAQQLFVAQSTVTNRIRDLETELGKSLFVRNHKQVELRRGKNSSIMPSGSSHWKSRPSRISRAVPSLPRRFISARQIRFMNVICKKASAPI